MSFEDYLLQRHTSGTTARYLREVNLYQEVIKTPENASYADIMDYLTARRKQGTSHVKLALFALKKYYSYFI